MEDVVNDLDEIWAYDEPHISGGNVHITMTKLQAIQYMWKFHREFCWKNNKTNEEIFQNWIGINWAYKEKIDEEKVN